MLTASAFARNKLRGVRRSSLIPTNEVFVPSPTPDWQGMTGVEGAGFTSLRQFTGITMPVFVSFEIVAKAGGGEAFYVEGVVLSDNNWQLPPQATDSTDEQAAKPGVVLVKPGQWLGFYVEAVNGGTFTRSFRVRNVTANNTLLDTIPIGFAEPV